MAVGPDRRFQLRTDTMTRPQAEAAQIDVGLRQYMLRVYNYMALGVAGTGIIAMLVSQNPALMQAIALGPFKWVLFIGILGLGFFAPKIMMTKSVGAAQACYWVYAAAWGALIAPMFYMYTGRQHRPGVLHYGGGVRRHEPLRLHHQTRSVGGRPLPGDGDASAS